MLELEEICFSIRKDGEDVNLLDHISLQIPRGHFMAIVGPSGCGKSTLLKTIAGLNQESAGKICWNGKNVAEEGDFLPSEIGYVPQFSIAYDPLTVDESVEAAAHLRVKSASREELDQRLDRVLQETGLTQIADRAVKVLSGGQKRRLGLAMELVSDPKLLLCDEVTSGLDPRSEHDIVHLLHDLSRKDGRVVLSVTHSLAHFECYDSILVLHEGRVVFHGCPEHLTHYFSVPDVESVYPRLAERPAADWQASWVKRREVYANEMMEIRKGLIASGKLANPPVAEPEEQDVTPSLLSQFFTLIARRWKIFFRDRSQVLLQLAILLCFPLLVTLFGDKAKEPIRQYSDQRQSDVMSEIREHQMVRQDQMKVGSAVSGIVMFQVVLLALMASNNSAREIAGERQIYEKEKFGGLRPSAYLASKIAFLACLVTAQSLWMAFFVNAFSPFRGDFMTHVSFLLMVNGAMTLTCLAISSLMKTAEQASLLSIYLVGFQLPLSGAVLALPEKVEIFTRPFIVAYWAWSGSVESLETGVQNAVKSVIDTSLSGSAICQIVLFAHMGLGIFAAWLGARNPQWD